MPRGFEPLGDERDELLLHDGVYAGYEQPVPAEAHTDRFPDFCLERYRELSPLQDWLVGLFG
jgi:hypothetical protein